MSAQAIRDELATYGIRAQNNCSMRNLRRKLREARSPYHTAELQELRNELASYGIYPRQNCGIKSLRLKLKKAQQNGLPSLTTLGGVSTTQPMCREPQNVGLPSSILSGVHRLIPSQGSRHPPEALHSSAPISTVATTTERDEVGHRTQSSEQRHTTPARNGSMDDPIDLDSEPDAYDHRLPK